MKRDPEIGEIVKLLEHPKTFWIVADILPKHPGLSDRNQPRFCLLGGMSGDALVCFSRRRFRLRPAVRADMKAHLRAQFALMRLSE